MADIQISEEGIIRFRKKLYHNSEVILAKCFNFDTSLETEKGVITANALVTSRKSIEHFVKLAFKSFSEALSEEDRRNEFYDQLDAFYTRRDFHVESIMKARLPYYETLFKHQPDTLKEAYHRKYNFLALEMGLGKTIISASLSRLHQHAVTLIVCPAAVKWNWYEDLTKRFGFNELFFTILDTSKRRTLHALNQRFIIINYDILGKYYDYFSKIHISHFIFDESHLIKNHNSQRYKNLKKIVDLYPDSPITFLSGSPIKNRVNDVFAYFKMIGHQLGSSYKKFLDEYTIRTSGRGGERVTGGRNLQDLNMKMSNFMIRKTKAECLDLPDKIYLSYRYELDDYRDEYDKIIKELSQLKDYKGLSGNLHSLNILASKAKLPGIKELAEGIIADGRKVVIFGSYKDPLNQLEAYFGNRCVKIDGSVDSWTRQQHVNRFVSDPDCMVFLGNYIAAGVGINLTNASDVITLNFPLTPADLYQAIDRLHRIGAKNSVNVHYTFADDSIDGYIYDIITDKEREINILIDDGKEANLRENFLEILMKKLLKKYDDTNVPVTKDVYMVEEKKMEKLPEEITKHIMSVECVKITDPNPDAHLGANSFAQPPIFD